MVTIEDWELLAKEQLQMAYAYLVGGAGDEVTLRGNRESFARIRLRPRMLVDVSEIDTSTVLFGETLKMPCPIGAGGVPENRSPRGRTRGCARAMPPVSCLPQVRPPQSAVEEIAGEAAVGHGFNSTPPPTGRLQRRWSIVRGKPGAVSLLHRRCPSKRPARP